MRWRRRGAARGARAHSAWRGRGRSINIVGEPGRAATGSTTITSQEEVPAWSDDWCEFFRERRLAPQIALARSNGFDALAREAERLLGVVNVLLADHDAAPSLVHGDLWSGNAALLDGGVPAVYDPAVYVGDREVDLAMTALFGGFGADFYAAYDAAFARPDGHAERRDLYDLYHLLNHVNLFGGGYLARTERTITRLLGFVVRAGRNR